MFDDRLDSNVSRGTPGKSGEVFFAYWVFGANAVLDRLLRKTEWVHPAELIGVKKLSAVIKSPSGSLT